MGDSRRFDVFAKYIECHWPDRAARIADVAGGKGGLCAALWQLGYRNIVTFDKRRNRANRNRAHYRYGFFGTTVDEPFDLVVAMHSDAGTDEAMDWAIQRGVPFAVVPCCTRPSRWAYAGPNDQDDWIAHLVAEARRRGALPTLDTLAMRGANRVLCWEKTQKGGQE